MDSCLVHSKQGVTQRLQRSQRRRDHSAAVGRNQTSVTTRTLSGPVDGGSDTERLEPRHVRNQGSRFFNAEKQEGEAQRTRRGRILALRAESDRTLRGSAILSFSVASAPPFLLLCVEKPACLPWIGSRDPLSVCLDWPTQRCAHLARHCAGSDLGRSAGESVRYWHPGGNSSRVAVIRRISSSEIPRVKRPGAGSEKEAIGASHGDEAAPGLKSIRRNPAVRLRNVASQRQGGASDWFVRDPISSSPHA